jgi:hypothetical protein
MKELDLSYLHPLIKHPETDMYLPQFENIIGRHFTKELASQVLKRTSTQHKFFPCTNAVNLSEKSLVKSLP